MTVLVPGQEAFDRACAGLASQGFELSVRCVVGNGDTFATRCAYRGGPCRRCALGWLIPDEIYTEDMELKMTAQVLGVLDVTSEADVAWFCRLQEAHDDAAWPADMQRRLRDFAHSHGLEAPTSIQTVILAPYSEVL